MEVEVLFDYEKQKDGELNLKVGQVVTNVTVVKRSITTVACSLSRGSGLRVPAFS